MSDLIARRVIHPMARDNYRIVFGDVEIGSVGIQRRTGGADYWSWGIDTVLPRQSFATHGEAATKAEALAAFRRAWDEFESDPERLQTFLTMIRNAARKW